MSRKMRATLLKASAIYCVGIAECSSGNDLLHSYTPYLNVKDLAMLWREQLKSETCFLEKVVSFKYGSTVSAKAIKLQYQTKTAESFRN